VPEQEGICFFVFCFFVFCFVLFFFNWVTSFFHTFISMISSYFFI
jgi:hypothetical protein